MSTSRCSTHTAAPALWRRVVQRRTGASRGADVAARILRVAYQPGRALHAALRRLPYGSFDVRTQLDLHPRPHYAYGVQQGALLAARLGIPRVSVLELGVAGGNGLLELERMAAAASRATGVHIDVYGFDRGEGLPEPSDYRDLAYTWQPGYFSMDVDALRAQLSSATLVLGDLSETIPTFRERHDPAPVAFVAVDLDYYSSTVDALKVFDGPDEMLLPRVLCWFDDLVGPDHVLHNDEVGELLAIGEFNAAHQRTKVLPINGLRAKRVVPAPWNESMFAMHRFDHKLYDVYVGPDPDGEQLPLDSPVT